MSADTGLALVGMRILMLGPHPAGKLPTQGAHVAAQLAMDGAHVHTSSLSLSRWVRPVAMLFALLRRGRRSDAVIVDTFAGIATFAYESVLFFVARTLGKKPVAVLRGGDFPEFAHRYPRWVKIALSLTRVVTPSGFLLDAMSSAGVTGTIIPNTIDIASFPFHARSKLRPRLLWARSFHHNYNPILAIDALEQLLVKWPDASLVMAGRPAGLEDACASAARLRHLPVEFVGQLSRQQLVAVARDCDIFINTNRLDNLPLTVIQMMALGLPVVATCVGGIPYLITDAESGLLVEADDARGMAEAVSRLLDQPELATKLSRAGRALAERHDWASVRPLWTATLLPT